MQRRWEYEVLRFELREGFYTVEQTDAQIVEQFNAMGADGWELAQPYVMFGSQVGALFKRPIDV